MNMATLELNPAHPIVEKLKLMVEADGKAQATKDYGALL